ncbi:hypothetical protein SAMN02746041_00137 [Desulfacinum hydrothermale DSM 13146]|uniref:Helix-turn-helix domain-containing protein n=1 Tax=Desulfacinum hydrothermale DSM 13146 TaxID=1121390 RepID=A0A1W1WYK1_9BACT|nr:hypothetical protein [Desulfacinum hydrothermale]SMC16673.1 hypothetical protein SAMN02746041_00137 [Desulfacinum hydrothermale DSM 13146]
MARMTVKAAAKALGVSCEVLEAYLAETGKLEEIRRGRRVFIPAEEVRALVEQARHPEDAKEEEAQEAKPAPPPLEAQAPPASSQTGAQLHEELGRLRAQVALLERYRAELTEKDTLLMEKEARIARLETELELLKRPWWRRLFRHLS